MLAAAGLLALAAAFPQTGLLHHLVFGFVRFLWRNLPRMSVNPDVWAPGVAAFALAGVILHFPAARWASRRGIFWNTGSSLAVAALLPVMFCTAFLVPGVILLLKMLEEAIS